MVQATSVTRYRRMVLTLTWPEVQFSSQVGGSVQSSLQPLGGRLAAFNPTRAVRGPSADMIWHSYISSLPVMILHTLHTQCWATCMRRIRTIRDKNALLLVCASFVSVKLGAHCTVGVMYTGMLSMHASQQQATDLIYKQPYWSR